jgi:hypothetical protein
VQSVLGEMKVVIDKKTAEIGPRHQGIALAHEVTADF